MGKRRAYDRKERAKQDRRRTVDGFVLWVLKEALVLALLAIGIAFVMWTMDWWN